MGGYHPSADPDGILESPVVDAVVRGEGEETLRAIRAVRSRRRLETRLEASGENLRVSNFEVINYPKSLPSLPAASHDQNPWPITNSPMPKACTHIPTAIIHLRPQRSLNAPVNS